MLFKDDFHEVGGWDLTANDWIEEVARTPDSDLHAHRIAVTYYKFATRWTMSSSGRVGAQQVEMLSNSSRCQRQLVPLRDVGHLTVSQNITLDRPPQRLNAGLGILGPAGIDAGGRAGQSGQRSSARARVRPGSASDLRLGVSRNATVPVPRKGWPVQLVADGASRMTPRRSRS